jgi:hypothetical protein
MQIADDVVTNQTIGRAGCSLRLATHRRRQSRGRAKRCSPGTRLETTGMALARFYDREAGAFPAPPIAPRPPLGPSSCSRPPRRYWGVLKMPLSLTDRQLKQVMQAAAAG